MPLARKHQIIPGQPGFYHCVSRCVRRAWLCGLDPLSGQCYDHRRDWMVERMRVLTTCFAIDVFAYSVMSNHSHIVLYVDPDRLKQLSDAELILRWKTLWNWRTPTRSITVPTAVSDEQIVLWRARLADVSWFMRLLNEPIARIANAEDGCKGHFWESRYKSIPLLDDAAVLACMTYVDLNPIKAGIAETLEDSDYTSIQERISSLCERGDEDALVTRVATGRATWGNKADSPPTLAISNQAYIELVRDTAESLRKDRSTLENSVLERLSIDPRGWIKSSTRFLELFRSAAGSHAAFEAYMAYAGRQRHQDAAGRRVLYRAY